MQVHVPCACVWRSDTNIDLFFNLSSLEILRQGLLPDLGLSLLLPSAGLQELTMLLSFVRWVWTANSGPMLKQQTGIDQQSCLQPPPPHTHKIHLILTAEMRLWLVGLVLAVGHSPKRDAV